MKINIAIDGPSAAGKSSLANSLARELNYTHLDTGLMYRAVAYLAKKYHLSFDDENNIVNLLLAKPMEVKGQDIYLDGEVLNKQLYGDEIALAASDVSKLKNVRLTLVKKQQEIAKNKGFILDGRDIGTVVLPDAELKIYLTASAEARAWRRTNQNIEKGLDGEYDEILAEIKKRDYQDTHRSNSPLRKAEDAILVDSSALDLSQVVEQITNLIKERGFNA